MCFYILKDDAFKSMYKTCIAASFVGGAVLGYKFAKSRLGKIVLKKPTKKES